MTAVGRRGGAVGVDESLAERDDAAETLHHTLMVLLNSNFAAVATTDAWIDAARSGAELPKSDLGTSATQGRAEFDA